MLSKKQLLFLKWINKIFCCRDANASLFYGIIEIARRNCDFLIIHVDVWMMFNKQKCLYEYLLYCLKLTYMIY